MKDHKWNQKVILFQLKSAFDHDLTISWKRTERIKHKNEKKK